MSDTQEHHYDSQNRQSEHQRSWLNALGAGSKNVSFKLIQDATSRLSQLSAQDYALWAAAATLLAMIPILLSDGGEREYKLTQSAEQKLHEALLNPDGSQRQKIGSPATSRPERSQDTVRPEAVGSGPASALEGRDALEAQSDEVLRAKQTVVWGALSRREQLDRLETYLNDLSETPEGQILADALRGYRDLDSNALEELLEAFKYRVLSADDRDVEYFIASWELGTLLSDRGLYVSVLPKELVPRLVALEQTYYREYAEVDPVDCGRLPLLVDTSRHSFPTMSLRVSAQELQLLKSRESTFALKSPALRRPPDQRHHSTILERAALGQNKVLETVEDLTALPYEDALKYQCHLALAALEYIAALEGSEQVSLYEDLFGTRFQYVNTETHSDFLLPEQVSLFSSIFPTDRSD